MKLRYEDLGGTEELSPDQESVLLNIMDMDDTTSATVLLTYHPSNDTLAVRRLDAEDRTTLHPLLVHVLDLLERKFPDRRFTHSSFTRVHLVDSQAHMGYSLHHIGPLLDLSNPSVRLWVQYRKFEGTRTWSLQVQDATDDAILNSSAEGSEQYDPSALYRD